MRLLIFLLLLNGALLGDSKDPFVLAATEGEPSFNIADCVSALTGDFIASETDYIVPGVEPIVLGRSYLSGDGHGESGGWEFFPHTRLTLEENPNRYFQDHDYHVAIACEPNGTRAVYSYISPGNFKIDIENNGKGLTNTSQGIISARTNLKNNTITEHNDKTIALISGDGRERIYRKIGHRTHHKALYLLDYEKLPNYNRIYYKFDGHQRLERIWTTNPTQTQVYCWAHFHYQDVPNKSNDFEIETSDGQRFYYKFRREGKKYEPNYYLTRTWGSVIPQELTEYHPVKSDTGPLIKKRIVGKRTISAQYFNSYSNDDSRMDRVHHLIAPVGPDGQDVTIYNFAYALDKVKKKGRYKYSGKGKTQVYDAYHHKSELEYSERFYPLTYASYEKSAVNHSLHMEWNTHGELQKRSLKDGFGNNIWQRTFNYDPNGNVTEENFEGYGKRYQHNQYSLITRIEEDNGLITHIAYLRDTPLVSKKFLGSKERILLREFYEYNGDNLLIKEISDNGSGSTSDDLTDVTVRKIKTYQLKQSQPALGFPEVIEEKYYENGQEIPLKKTRLTYTKECKIASREIYDANDKLYSRHITHYDEWLRPYEEIDSLGRSIKTSYDIHGNKIKIDEFNGRKVTHFTYDSANRESTIEEVGFDNIKRLTQNKYNKKSEKTAVIDFNGHTTTFAYDPFSNQKEITEPSGAKTHKTYDAAGREASITDPLGHKTTKQYNAYNLPTLITLPDGATETNRYNSDGTLRAMLDPNGTRTLFTYDVLGKITSKKIIVNNQVLQEETFTYDGFNLITKKDASGALTTYTYDGAGRKTSETLDNSGLLERTNYTYDSLGRPHTTQIGDLIQITEYDQLDRIVEERTEDTQGTLISQTTYGYDTAGNKNQISRKTANGTATEATLFDSFNRPTEIVNALGHRTTIIYNEKFQNAKGQFVFQKTTIDPSGLQTVETYDISSRIALIEKKDSFNTLLASEEIIHDLAGNQIRQISTIFNPDKSTRISATRWTYGPLKRLLSVIEAAGTNDAKITRFTYDRKGLRSTITKPSGTTITYTYDPLSRCTEVSSSDSTIHYRFEYNSHNLPTLCEDLLTNTIVTKSYDLRGRITQETLPNNTLTYTYDAQGRRTQCTLPDNSAIHYTYDAAYLRTIQRSDPTDATLYEHTYTEYDPSGYLLQEKLIADLGTLDFTVDKLGRITSLSCPYRKESIEAFDPSGNILARILNQRRHAYTYDTLNQLTSEKANTYTYDSHFNRLSKNENPYQIDSLNKVITNSTDTYTYDKNGNLLSKQTPTDTITYTYDAFDRLTSIANSTTHHTYTYDGWHRRLSKTTPTQTSYFLYDGDNEIGATDGTTIHELRILGQGRGAEISAAIAIELDNRIFVPIHDLFGNVTELIPLDGTQPITYTYSAFGEDTANSYNTIQSPWRFSSKRTETDFNLVFFGRRYYQPDLGRWLTPDPDGFTDSLNLYAFVLNAPLTHLDLYGLVKKRNEEGGFSMPAPHDIKAGELMPAYMTTAFTASGYSNRLHDTLWQDSYKHRIENPMGKIIFVNGINNSLREAKDSMRHTSNLGGGVPVHLMYNPTKGVGQDVLRAIGTFCNITHTSTVGKLRSYIIDSLLEVGPKGKLMLTGHSMGAIIIRDAMRGIPEALREQIEIVAIAPGKIMRGDLASSVINYARHFDPVVFHQVPAIARGLKECNLIYVPRAKGESKLFDHTYQSKSYSPHISQRVLDFSERYNCI